MIKWHPEKFLKKLDKTLVDKLDESASHVAEESKTRAPVKTGNLRDSIDYTVNEYGELKATVKSHAPYSLFLELGTRKMSPRAYLRPALDASIGFINNIFSRK